MKCVVKTNITKPNWRVTWREKKVWSRKYLKMKEVCRFLSNDPSFKIFQSRWPAKAAQQLFLRKFLLNFWWPDLKSKWDACLLSYSGLDSNTGVHPFPSTYPTCWRPQTKNIYYSMQLGNHKCSLKTEIMVSEQSKPSNVMAYKLSELV